MEFGHRENRLKVSEFFQLTLTITGNLNALLPKASNTAHCLGGIMR